MPFQDFELVQKTTLLRWAAVCPDVIPPTALALLWHCFGMYYISYLHTPGFSTSIYDRM